MIKTIESLRYHLTSYGVKDLCENDDTFDGAKLSLSTIYRLSLIISTLTISYSMLTNQDLPLKYTYGFNLLFASFYIGNAVSTARICLKYSVPPNFSSFVQSASLFLPYLASGLIHMKAMSQSDIF